MRLFCLCQFILFVLFTFDQHGKTSASKSSSEIFSLDFTELDEYNPPKSGAEIEVDQTIELRSLCIRISISDDPLQTIVFSKDFYLTFNFQDGYGYFNLNGKNLIFKTPYVPVPNNVFEHFCFSHNKTHYTVVSQGTLWFNTTFWSTIKEKVNKPTRIDRLHFGPMASSYGYGGTYFDGKITDLNIFSKSFTTKELIEITSNCSSNKKIYEKGTKVFEWSKLQSSKVKLPQNSNINIVKIKNDYFCSELQSKLLGYIPFPMDIYTANTACIAWSGQLNLPDDKEELELMKNLTINQGAIVKNFTEDSKMCGNAVWVPLHKSEDLSHWVNYNDRSEKIVPITPIDQDGLFLQTCANNVPIGSNHLVDISCSKKICAFCEWRTLPSFRLRGLCGKSIIEDRYVLSTEQFDGFLGNQLINILRVCIIYVSYV